ncbi:type II secretion system protein GspL [uncultured Sphingomonas sp.]|uniref:type II secretion system protein GspL n=1 Tax=uncultured Sphingomonas sp. TaxID=158754 RepID=UPI0035CADAF1
MSDTTLLFLPSGDDGYRWWRLAGNRVVARGEGLPPAADTPDDAGETVAVPPADAVTLHWAQLPTRSAAQGLAAARLLAADASAAPIGELHVAVGQEDGVEQPIGVVSAAQMRAWLVGLAEAGVDPDRIVPAPMLLPRPGDGYVRAAIGGRDVVRGATSGFADEAWLTPLVTGDTPPVRLAPDAMEQALATALAAPALNLRQGAFARRRAGIDWALVRRLGWLALAILTVTLAADLVRVARYDLAASAAEARADQLARAGLPSGETANDPDAQLDERLAGLRGPGRGFTRTAAIVFTAVRSVPGTEATALDWSATGNLRVSVAVQTQGQAAALRDAIARTGLGVTASTFAAADGRLTGDLTVRAR